MAQPNARLTLRQMRLAAFIRDPQPPPIDDEAIDWRAACWNAPRLIESSGVYEADTPTVRRQCLNDLAALTQAGVLMKLRTGDPKTGRPVWRVEVP